MTDYLATIADMLDREPECTCGHDKGDHWFGCEAVPDEGCPCTAIYPDRPRTDAARPRPTGSWGEERGRA